MRLVCPNCKANYEIPRDAVPISGREVKCASCGHSWFQARTKKTNDEKLKAPEGKFIEENSIEVENTASNQKKIDPSDPRGVRLRSAAKDMKENQDFSSALNYIIIFVGIGTLLAGVIGISNIMVFVIKERTKEFGIRKAVGATPSSIIWMVLQESIFITTISGYFGLFVGVVFLSSLGNTLKEDFYITDPYVDLNTALMATIMLIIFGAIAGYIPARRASKIKPIVALNDK